MCSYPVETMKGKHKVALLNLIATGSEKDLLCTFNQSQRPEAKSGFYVTFSRLKI